MTNQTQFLTIGLLALSLGACGSVSAPDDDIDEAAPDAGLPTSPEVLPPADDPPPPNQPRCDLSKPFGLPVEVASVNSVNNEWSGTTSADELVMIVGSDRTTGNNDLYIATRESVNEPFGAPTMLMQTETAHEGGGRLSADSLSMVLHADLQTSGAWDLYIATRPSTAAAFGTPAVIANVNSPTQSENFPFVTADGKSLYFERYTNGVSDIYRATRTGSGAFGVAEPVAELNTVGNDQRPLLTPDELSIYMTRDGDIYIAKRSSKNDPFGTPVAIAELNTAASDYPLSLSADGCALYFNSDGRASATGGLDMFVALRGK